VTRVFDTCIRAGREEEEAGSPATFDTLISCGFSPHLPRDGSRCLQ